MGASIDQAMASIKRGAVQVIDEASLKNKLIAAERARKPLRVKLGLDPSRPDIHLGHTIVFNKLRTFQDLGHMAVLVIGDFTAQIGDPSGRNKLRPRLSSEEVQENAKTYIDQAFKILDPKNIEIAYNASWLSRLSAHNLITMCASMSVARMLERDDFSKRYSAGTPIFLHEFIYPLLQGYDSVMLKSDIELGGTDQTFNLLVGRDLQRENGLPPQDIVTMPLLEGLDGIMKMSKSFDNAITLNDPPQEMYGKIMSISDEMMFKYYELLSFKSIEEIKHVRDDIAATRLHPMDAKMAIARELTARFHNAADADAAAAHFDAVHRQRGMPDEMPVVTMSEDRVQIAKLAFSCGFVKSMKETRRKIEEGAVTVNGQKITNPLQEIEVSAEPQIIRFGKRHFRKFQKR